jgi:hypothetical protein
MNAAKPRTKGKPTRTTLFGGQPVELALCRQFGRTLHMGDLMYVSEILTLPERVQPIRDWRVAGPFKSPTPGKIDFDMSTPVEDAFAALGEGNVDLSAAYEVPGRSVRWQETHGDTEGVVDLDGPLGRVEWATAYGHARIDSPCEQAVLFAMGSDDSVKVWLNGRVVHVNNEGGTCLRKMAGPYFVSPFQEFMTLPLVRGHNHLLIRVNNFTLGWGFVVGTIKE